jgi:hypothetical protein
MSLDPIEPEETSSPSGRKKMLIHAPPWYTKNNKKCYLGRQFQCHHSEWLRASEGPVSEAWSWLQKSQACVSEEIVD